jgi:hypothetical protein
MLRGSPVPRFVYALALALAACGGGDDAPPDDRDIAERLADVAGLTVEERQGPQGYRFFYLTYDQPADHDAPDGVRFAQRATLMHRDVGAPMVLHTTGYGLIGFPFLGEVAALLRGNQLSVEQRFFAPSRPQPTDWSLLTIEQAAADHHRLVEALSPIYPAAWLSTGASKGGMTSVYHRRFYPDDVAGTVAYVAPISFGAPDRRYEPFLDQIGPADCRQALRDHQATMLERRAAMVPRVEALAATEDLSFERSGGVEVAFEDSVLEFPWLFWQYGGAAGCAGVPTAGASDDELFAYHVSSGGLSFYDDASVLYYQPYYLQAETQLGYPSMPREHLGDAVLHEDAERPYLPDGVAVSYDPAAMVDVDAWLKAEGERLIFVYGGDDPWTGGAFELGQAVDSLSVVAAGKNHGADIVDLSPADRDAVLDLMEAWTGVQPSARAASARIREGRWRLPPPRNSATLSR